MSRALIFVELCNCFSYVRAGRAKGSNIQEGPGLNIARIEKNGRTFEYISGEDPVLGAQLGVRVVAGIQKNVMAIAKHYLPQTITTLVFARSPRPSFVKQG